MEPDYQGEIVLLHFNDAYNIEHNHQGQLGFLNFYHHLVQTRLKHTQSLLFFSGDAFAPSKLSRIFKGYQIAHTLKMLNIDAACYGNHDFDYSLQHSLKLAKHCGFPWLLSNIKFSDTARNLGEGLDYLIQQHNGTKIGIMGLAGPDFIATLPKIGKNQLTYLPIVEQAKKIAKLLLDQHCQLIVALTHCRIKIEENLAAEVPDIDLILGGHDHRVINELINQIPIVKSGSDFEFLSIVKIRRKEKSHNKEVRVGRRWVFDIRCSAVGKATQRYPEIQNYINYAIAEYKEAKIPQKKKQNQDKWLLSYQMRENRQVVLLKAGSSAEICFAKYVAFKKNLIYYGCENNLPKLNENSIEETLQIVAEEVKQHINPGKTVLYSPGFSSTPYLIETGNLIYLPSHFAFSFHSLKDLQLALKKANEIGISCYAIIQNWENKHQQLCVLIKFSHPPPQYTKLINNLSIENIIFMSLIRGKEVKNQAKLLLSPNIQLQREFPISQNVYLILERTKQTQLSFMDHPFRKKMNISEQFWKEFLSKPNQKYIQDSQQGIDCIQFIQSRFRQQLSASNIKYYYTIHTDISKLSQFTLPLAKQFIYHNFNQDKHPILLKGVVLNQRFHSNPTFELNSGFVPLLLSLNQTSIEEKIDKFMNYQEKLMRKWFNLNKDTNIQWQKIKKQNDFQLIITEQGRELGRWLAKNAPKIYNLKYLPIYDLLNVLAGEELLFIASNTLNQLNEKVKLKKLKQL